MENQLVSRFQAERLHNLGFNESCAHRYVGDEIFAGSIHPEDPQPHVLRCPTVAQAYKFMLTGGAGIYR